MDKAALIAKAAQLPEGALDEVVHDMKSAEAAAINNGGVEDQVSYLLDQRYDEAELAAYIENWESDNK